MKVKQSPHDFRVEELTDAEFGPRGEFAFYRLHKTGWTTHDALRILQERWQIESRRVNYGGLKDRHAETIQYLTIFQGPKRGLEQQRLALTYLGQRWDPYTSRDIRANRFDIVLRSLSASDEQFAQLELERIHRTGIPNYFDDQRFGSVTADRQFVAREMVFGRYESALKLALAAPYEYDRSEQKREKETLRQHWGDWATCKAELPRGHARSLVDYLIHHPADFKGAVARLRPELGGLYVSAYQSYLWNALLAGWLRKRFPAECLGQIELQLGSFPVPRQLPAELSDTWLSLQLPLPTSRMKPNPEADWMPILEEILAAEQLTLKQLKIPGLDRPFFSKGDRAACIQAWNLGWRAGPDEENRGRRKLALGFELPRGCYATMLIKRITIGEWAKADSEPESE